MCQGAVNAPRLQNPPFSDGWRLRFFGWSVVKMPVRVFASMIFMRCNLIQVPVVCSAISTPDLFSPMGYGSLGVSPWFTPGPSMELMAQAWPKFGSMYIGYWGCFSLIIFYCLLTTSSPHIFVLAASHEYIHIDIPVFFNLFLRVKLHIWIAFIDLIMTSLRSHWNH